MCQPIRVFGKEVSQSSSFLNADTHILQKYELDALVKGVGNPKESVLYFRSLKVIKFSEGFIKIGEQLRK